MDILSTAEVDANGTICSILAGAEQPVGIVTMTKMYVLVARSLSVILTTVSEPYWESRMYLIPM